MALSSGSGFSNLDLLNQAKRITLTDRVDMRLSGIVSLRERWPNQWFSGIMVADPSVVIEFSFAGWDTDPSLCLMKTTPITYLGMFRGKKDIFEFSLGHTPVMPSLDVARELLLPVVNALMGFQAKACAQVVASHTSRNAC